MRHLVFLILFLVVAAPVLAQSSPSGAAASSAPAKNGGYDEPATPTPGPPVPAAMVFVPGGTNVSVSLGETVSSSNATVGETVPIVVDQEVDIGGFVVIPKGSNGQATIATVDHAGGNGHGGKLAITFDWVYSADHGKILLSNTNHAAGEDTDKKGAASTATILSYVFLGPLGLFAHNFVRGQDVTVDTTRVFKVFVDHDVHVEAVQKAVATPGFDN